MFERENRQTIEKMIEKYFDRDGKYDYWSDGYSGPVYRTPADNRTAPVEQFVGDGWKSIDDIDAMGIDLSHCNTAADAIRVYSGWIVRTRA